MITPVLKDAILNFICDNCPLERLVSIDCKLFLKQIETTKEILNAVMKQFERMGFIEHYGSSIRELSFAVRIDAVDYKNRGGFLVQEQLYADSLLKLELDIKQLSEQFPENANTFTTVLANIATVLSFIQPFVK